MRRVYLLILAICLATPIKAAPGSAADTLDRLFGGPFELTAADNHRVNDVSLRGRFMLIMFGYTNCPDICPTGLATVGEALDSLADKASAVRPVFITVDPARDTPQKLSEYGKNFDPRFLMLTGSESEIAAVAKAYRVHRQTYVVSDNDLRMGHYGVDHGSLMYLMGPDGKFRTLFPHGTTAEKLGTALRQYLSQR